MNDPPGAPASNSRPGVPERPRESPVRDAPRLPAPDSRPAVPERPYEPPVDELPRPPAGAPARPDELPRPPALLAGAPPRLDAPPRWPAPDSRSAGTGCPWESRAPGSYREPLAPDRPVARGSVRRAGSEPTGRPRVPATGRLAGLRGVPSPPLERGRSDRSLLTGSIPFRGARLQKRRWGPPKWSPSRKDVRRRPTLPRSPPRSTIGAERLSFRVRDGTGRFPFAMVAETLWRCGRT